MAPAPEPTGNALVDAHTDVHVWLEDRVYDVLEALVARDLSRARAAWRSFVAVLDEHMAFEDQHVMRAYEDTAPADGPGRADHVEGDHTILVRHTAAIEDVLAALDDRTTLRAILEALPVFYRLLGTLEHHTMREATYVYPALARTVPAARAHDVIVALRGLVDRARRT